MKNLFNYLGLILIFGLIFVSPPVNSEDVSDVFQVSQEHEDASVDIVNVAVELEVAFITLADKIEGDLIDVGKDSESYNSIQLQITNDFMRPNDLRYLFLINLNYSSKQLPNYYITSTYAKNLIIDPGRFYFGNHLIQKS